VGFMQIIYWLIVGIVNLFLSAEVKEMGLELISRLANNSKHMAIL